MMVVFLLIFVLGVYWILEDAKVVPLELPEYHRIMRKTSSSFTGPRIDGELTSCPSRKWTCT